MVVASLAQGGLGVEGLEEEEPEGALEGEEALAAVGAAVALLEEVVREEGGEEELEFRDGVGTWGAEASAEGAAVEDVERAVQRICAGPYMQRFR